MSEEIKPQKRDFDVIKEHEIISEIGWFYDDRESESSLETMRNHYEIAIEIEIVDTRRCKMLRVQGKQHKIFHIVGDVCQELGIGSDEDAQYNYGVKITKSKPKKIDAERCRELYRMGYRPFSNRTLTSEGYTKVLE